MRALLKFFFHHLYHNLAWGYDLIAAAVSLGHWKDWGSAAMEFMEGTRVLELGFGPGHLHAALHASQYRVYGLDESPQMIALATKKLERLGFSPSLCRGMMQKTPFASNLFDTLIATFPSDYIFQAESLTEAMRVLRADARMVVLVSAWPSGESTAGKILQALFAVTGQGAPIQEALIERASQPFIQAGFEVEPAIRHKAGSSLLFILARKPSTM